MDSLDVTLEIIEGPTCDTCADGSIKATVFSGNPLYTYEWSTGDSTTKMGNMDTLVNLPPGMYCVTITDANGCTGVDCIEVPPPPTCEIDVAVTNEPCDDPGNGTATLIINGCIDPVTIVWSTGQMDTTFIDGLSAGTHSVTVTDSAGTVAIDTFVVGKDSMLIVEDSINNIACDSVELGSIYLNVLNGTGAYTVQWEPGGIVNNDLFRVDLGPGTYYVTITDDTSGCVYSDSFEIVRDTVLQLNPEVKHIPCLSPNELGNITLNVTGGSGNYIYQWAHDPTITGPFAGNLPLGVYKVTVIDTISGCMGMDSIAVEIDPGFDVMATIEPAMCKYGSITLEIKPDTNTYTVQWLHDSTLTKFFADSLVPGSYTVIVTDSATQCTDTLTYTVPIDNPLNVMDVITPASCDGMILGNIILTVTGGSGEYTFVWDIPGAGDTSTVGNLPPGTYTVTITDTVLCCELVLTYKVVEDNNLDISADITNVSCDGSMLGSIDLTVTGGSGMYTYMWSDSTLNGMEDPTGLMPGIYIVKVTDTVTQCMKMDTFEVGQEMDLMLAADVTQPLCYGVEDGSIMINVLMGVPPYMYEWSHDSTLTGPFANSLPAGSYTVTVTDSTGCRNDTTIVLMYDSVITITAITTNVSCSGGADGTLTITIDGGFPPYTVMWAHDSTLTDTMLDSLVAGTYTVKVTDTMGCMARDSFDVEENPPLQIDFDVMSESCMPGGDGMATANVSGGTPPYSYLWSTATGDTTQKISGLMGGSMYSVTVTDSLGCVDSATVTIPETPMPQAAIDFDYDLCSEDSIVIQFFDATIDTAGVVNGWLWKFNDTITSTLQNPTYTVYDSQTVKVVLIITTVDSCIDSTMLTITVVPPKFNMADTLGICEGDSVALNPNGDTTCQYVWSPAGSLDDPNAVNPIATPSSTTTYTVDITCFGADTCMLTKTVTVVVTPEPNIEVPNDTVICDSTITLIGSSTNGTTLQWFNSQGMIISDTAFVTVMPDDSSYYIFAVSDQTGCTVRDTVLVVEGKVDVSVPGNQLVCRGDDVMLTISNLDPLFDNLTYDWSPDPLLTNPDSATVTFNTSDTGTYHVFVDVENQYGCKYSDSLTVVVVDTSSQGGNLEIFDYVQCADDSTVSFFNYGSPYFTLHYGDPTYPDSASSAYFSEHKYPAPGLYTVTLLLTDTTFENACVDSLTQVIEVLEPPIWEPGYFYVYDTCAETSVVTFTDTTSHSQDDVVRYEWIFTDPAGNMDTISTNPATIPVTGSGLYGVQITVFTALGCAYTYSDQAPLVVMDSINIADTLTICLGDSVSLNDNSKLSYIYNWSPDGTLSDPNAANPLAFPTTTTTYTAMIMDSTEAVCAVTREVTVVVTTTNLMTSQDSFVCGDSSVMMTVDFSGGGGFEWSDDPSFIPVLGMGSQFTGNPGADQQYYYVRAVDAACPAVDSILLVNASFEIQISEDTIVCLDDMGMLQVTSTLDSTYEFDYLWTGDDIIGSDTDDSVTVMPTQDGFYYLTAENQYGCDAIDSAFVAVDDFNSEVGAATADRNSFFAGTCVNLTVDVNDPNATFEWTPANLITPPNTTQTVKSCPEFDGEQTYTVIVTNENGCIAERSVPVTVLPTVCGPPNIFFPNAFSPNNDGENDVLFLRAINVREVYFAIYNRWGQLIFESSDLNRGWDGTFGGKLMSPDVYGYYLKVTCPEGEYFEKGNVTLFR